jgi:hypothetical protein
LPTNIQMQKLSLSVIKAECFYYTQHDIFENAKIRERNQRSLFDR